MAETKISNTDTYQGVYPTVFKKINSSDVSLTPFQSYKQWVIGSGSATSSCLPLNGIYSDILPYLETELTYNDAKNVDDSLQTITYQSIDHLFYKYKTQPYYTFGPTNINRTKKYLYQSASILSFPHKKIGEGIKPASFSFTGSVFGDGIGSTLLRIHSDRYGNLYNSTFPTQSIITGVTFFEGFNDYFDTSKITYESQNVAYVPGVTGISSSGAMKPVGLAADFSNGGYIKTIIQGDYTRDTNYAISFFVSGSSIYSGFSGPNQLLVAKASGSNTQQYPFKVELSGSSDVVFSIGGGTSLLTINSGPLAGYDWAHILCQKTGSSTQLYVDGLLVNTGSATFLTNTYNPLMVSARIDNTDSLMIGGYGDHMYSLTGSIDEIRIFNRALSALEISKLQERRDYNGNDISFIQNDIVGNVFSKQGLVVMSTLDYRFHNILHQPYTASYRSTLTSYELGVVTKIDSGDFTLSLNPTLTADNDVSYHSFVTGSNFTPYITTIGLYDDAGQLLAIGKLAQPIKKPSNVDLNFLVRMDLNNNVIPR
jgi:hypothetical protein